MTIRHQTQETGFSCAAACLSMVLGIPESECRRLAKTKRNGTYMRNAYEAVRRCGRSAIHVDLSSRMHEDDRALERCRWFLDAQAQRWPLVLSCTFRQTALDSRMRKRTLTRHHAIVIFEGRVYDPGELTELDAECIGHSGDRGITVNEYILIEP